MSLLLWKYLLFFTLWWSWTEFHLWADSETRHHVPFLTFIEKIVSIDVFESVENENVDKWEQNIIGETGSLEKCQKNKVMKLFIDNRNHVLTPLIHPLMQGWNLSLKGNLKGEET